MMDLTVLTSYKITFSNNKSVSGESTALLEYVEEGSRPVLKTNRLILVSACQSLATWNSLMKLGSESFDVNSYHSF